MRATKTSFPSRHITIISLYFSGMASNGAWSRTISSFRSGAPTTTTIADASAPTEAIFSLASMPTTNRTNRSRDTPASAWTSPIPSQFLKIY